MCSLCKATFICYVLPSFRNNSGVKSLFVEGKKNDFIVRSHFFKVCFQVIIALYIFLSLQILLLLPKCQYLCHGRIDGLSRAVFCPQMHRLLQPTMLSSGFLQHQPRVTAAFPPLTDLYLFVSLCLHWLF